MERVMSGAARVVLAAAEASPPQGLVIETGA